MPELQNSNLPSPDDSVRPAITFAALPWTLPSLDALLYKMGCPDPPCSDPDGTLTNLGGLRGVQCSAPLAPPSPSACELGIPQEPKTSHEEEKNLKIMEEA